MIAEKNSEISERILEILDFYGITRNTFGEKLGYDRSQSIYDITSKPKSGKKPTKPSFDFFSRFFNSEYSELIDPTWLFTGKGKMIKEKEGKKISDPALSYFNSNPEVQLIPLLSREVIGGFGSDSFTIQDTDIEAYYLIPEFKHKNIDFMMRVRGVSMSPCYNSGDVVACTIIRSRSFFQWNSIHVVATKEQGIILKRIKEAENKNYLRLVSDNNDYGSFDIPKSEITGLALVAGGVKIE